MKIKVVLVEDEREIRESLTMLINGSFQLSCIAAFASAEEAISGIPALEADVVLMDIHLGGKSGVDCVRAIKQQ